MAARTAYPRRKPIVRIESASPRIGIMKAPVAAPGSSVTYNCALQYFCGNASSKKRQQPRHLMSLFAQIALDCPELTAALCRVRAGLVGTALSAASVRSAIDHTRSALRSAIAASGQVFDPEMIRDLARALDGACEMLGLSVSECAETRLMAENLIRLAQRGVHDTSILQAMVLQEFDREFI